VNNIKVHREQLTLGEFIDRLADAARHGAADHIAFDFCGLVPTSFASSRGDYSEIALGWADQRGSIDSLRRAREEWPEPSVATLLDRARRAIGVRFPGWKGGGCTATQGTLLWVDNPGEWSNTTITGVELCDGVAVIRTARVET